MSSLRVIPHVIAYYISPIARSFLSELVVNLRFSRKPFLRLYLDSERKVEVDIYRKHATIDFTNYSNFYMLRIHEDAVTFTISEENSECKSSFTIRKESPRIYDLEEIAVKKILDFYMSSDEDEAIIETLVNYGTLKLEPCRHGRHIMFRVHARLPIRSHLYVATPFHVFINKKCQLEITRLPEAQCTTPRMSLVNVKLSLSS